MGSEIQRRRPTPAHLTTTQSQRDKSLSPEARQLIFEGVPENTRRAYRAAWAKFSAWCEGAGRTPEPTTVETVVEYIGELSRQGMSPSTVQVALAAIRKRHDITDLPVPRSERITRAYLGHVKRWLAAGNRPKRATPARLDPLRAMVETCDLEKAKGVRDRAILLLGFAMMARRSEMAGLDLRDLTVSRSGLEVYVAMSKTDQAGHGATTMIPYGSSPETCPVRAVEAWLGLLHERGVTDGPVFRPVDRHGHISGDETYAGSASRLGARRLSAQAMETIVKQSAKKAGLKTGRWVPHSLRAGGASEAADAGADVLTIARHGRWSEKSPVVFTYVREVDKWKRNPMQGIGL